MAAAFVNPTYSSRAFWTGLVMVLAIIEILNNYAPYPASPAGYSFPVAFLIGVVGALPFTALFLVVFAFVDRTILVAMDMDFFHRNTLRWPQVRRPLYIILTASIGLAVVAGSYGSLVSPSDNLAGIWLAVTLVMFLGAVIVGLGFSIAGLIVAARRTQDSTMKRFVIRLGLTVAAYMGATITSNGSIVQVNLANDLFGLAAVYLLYLTAMSLSPLGKIAKSD